MAVRIPDRVGVYGGGRMGAGIAQVFAGAGAQVIVVEGTPETAEAARDRLARTGGTFTGRVTTDPAGLRDCALVIEAVPEDAGLKARVLSRAERHAPRADLATNTSSLSIDGLAAGLRRPERLIGLHFFNPVPVSRLIEIVVGAATAPDLVSRARGWVTALGRTAVTVTDSPGFASSRLGIALALEAIRMVESGVAPAEDIDTAMTLGYGHSTGPLRTTDIVGLDVRLAVAEHLTRELGPRFEPPRLLKDLVGQGHLGRKTGRGFYVW